MSQFELDDLPISNLYSESEETKALRHKYYETKSKLSIYKIIATIVSVLGVAILGIFLINVLTNLGKREQYSYALLYIGVIFLMSGIIMAIVLTQIANNILNPIDEDIKRSIMNDQLELAGAKTNRKTTNLIKLQENSNIILQLNYKKLKN